MANPQRENGTTDIANDIVEAIMKIHLSGYENRILWAIFRKTYGWHKKEDWITNSQIAKMTNIAESHTSRTIKILIQRKLVTKNGKKLAFQKDYDKWGEVTKNGKSKKLPIQDKKLPKMVNEVTRNGIKKLPKMVDTKQKKQTITKQTIQNKEIFPFLKDKVFNKAFKDYLDTRKVKATENAIELRLKDLHKYDIKTAITMIENSIMNGWQGIFPVEPLKPSKPQQKEHVPDYLTHRLGTKRS